MIGGNINAFLEVKQTSKNEYGEDVVMWNELCVLKGFLDLMSGNSNYQTFNAKVQESTHMFICDYQPINVTETQARLVVDNKVYDITLIDNPMNLNKHLEFYLKYVGD